MTSPDVARSMAAHPSTQRPKVVHVACIATGSKLRLCGTPSPPRWLSWAQARGRQLCVVCEDMAAQTCPHCGGNHSSAPDAIRRML